MTKDAVEGPSVAALPGVARLETELQELVERLDHLVPKDGAHLTIPADAGGDSPIGNRLGYLRFGIEFLAAALHPLPASDTAPARVVPNLRYFLAGGSATMFGVCELDESIGSRPPARARLGLAGQLLVGVFLVLTLVLLFIGAAVMWRWVFG